MALQAPVVIEGVRLRLRRSTPADAPAIFAMATDPEVMRYMDWPMPQHSDETRHYLDGCALRWHTGREFHWVIERKADGLALGCAACRPAAHSADFGYFLARAHWGQGLATEAAGLLLGWLQRQPHIVRVWATTDQANSRSAAVLRKLGLQQEGVMRQATLRPNLGGPPRDTGLYAWVRSAAPIAVESVNP
jgi:ribosomal-protein-alanine N-acetyltransferase